MKKGKFPYLGQMVLVSCLLIFICQCDFSRRRNSNNTENNNGLILKSTTFTINNTNGGNVRSWAYLGQLGTNSDYIAVQGIPGGTTEGISFLSFDNEGKKIGERYQGTPDNNNNGGFGSSIAAFGDRDESAPGDAYLIVGAPLVLGDPAASNPTSGGALYGLDVNADTTIANFPDPLVPARPGEGHIRYGFQNFTFLGGSLATLEDVLVANGTSRISLLAVGEPTSSINQGSVQIDDPRSQTTSTPVWLRQRSMQRRFGISTAHLGNFGTNSDTRGVAAVSSENDISLVWFNENLGAIRDNTVFIDDSTTIAGSTQTVSGIASHDNATDGFPLVYLGDAQLEDGTETAVIAFSPPTNPQGTGSVNLLYIEKSDTATVQKMVTIDSTTPNAPSLAVGDDFGRYYLGVANGFPGASATSSVLVVGTKDGNVHLLELNLSVTEAEAETETETEAD